MATTSIIAAVMSKYDGLTAANFPGGVLPPIYLDDPPLKDGGAQVRPPYVVLRDQGQTPTGFFDRTTLEECRFVMEVYYPTPASGGPLANVDAAVTAIKRNGGAVGAGSGFDYGTLSDLTTPRSTHEIRRARETRRKAGFDHEGKTVYVCFLEYLVTVQESP